MLIHQEHYSPNPVSIIKCHCYYNSIMLVRSKTMHDSPTQTELITILVPRLTVKWHAVGIALGLNPDQLKEIQDNRCDDRDGCLKDVLSMWEENATDKKPYKWATMLDILKFRKIGEEDFSLLLANILKKCEFL